MASETIFKIYANKIKIVDGYYYVPYFKNFKFTKHAMN